MLQTRREAELTEYAGVYTSKTCSITPTPLIQYSQEVYVGFLAMFTGGGGPSASGYGGLTGSRVLIGKVYCLPSTCIGVLGGTGGPEVEPDDTRCRG